MGKVEEAAESAVVEAPAGETRSALPGGEGIGEHRLFVPLAFTGVVGDRARHEAVKALQEDRREHREAERQARRAAMRDPHEESKRRVQRAESARHLWEKRIRGVADELEQDRLRKLQEQAVKVAMERHAEDWAALQNAERELAGGGA